MGNSLEEGREQLVVKLDELFLGVHPRGFVGNLQMSLMGHKCEMCEICNAHKEMEKGKGCSGGRFR